MLPIVEEALQKLKDFESQPSQYEGGKGYWDDYCLAELLHGVLLRYVAYPVRVVPFYWLKSNDSEACNVKDPDAIVDLDEQMPISQKDASTRAVAALEFVFAHGPSIEYDHHIVYYAREYNLLC
jgi:hypothetical protein